MTSPLKELLTKSYDSSANVRIESAEGLSTLNSDDAAVARLGELLRDDIVQVEVAAAEWLLKRCGSDGLALVLDELVERINDPDTDYIRFMVLEVAATTRTSLLAEARALAEKRDSNELRKVIQQLAFEQDQMRKIPAHRIQAENDGE